MGDRISEVPLYKKTPYACYLCLPQKSFYGFQAICGGLWDIRTIHWHRFSISMHWFTYRSTDQKILPTRQKLALLFQATRPFSRHTFRTGKRIYAIISFMAPSANLPTTYLAVVSRSPPFELTQHFLRLGASIAFAGSTSQVRRFVSSKVLSDLVRSWKI